MVTTSRQLDLVREVADRAGGPRGAHLFGVSTDAATTSLTVAAPPFKSQRTNASNKEIAGSSLGEGDELYLAPAQASSTIITSALSAAGTSFVVASGTAFAASTITPYVVGIDQEYLLVTRATDTFTILARGLYETRPAVHVVGATVYGPTLVANPDMISSYVASTGVMQPANTTWSADPGTVVPFDIFGRGVSLWDVRLAVNQALSELKDDSTIPFSKITDGDMRNPGTSDWTTSGSPTVSKVTNSNATHGPQSLRVLATVANDYVQSNTIIADPAWGKQRTVLARVRADVGTATLRAYDVTNSAEIESETVDVRGWRYVAFPFTLPATCEAYAYQLESDTSTSDVYWSSVNEIASGAVEVDLPSYVERPGEVIAVLEDWSDNRSDQPRWVEATGHVVGDPANPNQQFKFHFNGSVHRPLLIHVSRPYPMLTADAQTTYADRELVVAAGAMNLCEMMASQQSSEHSDFWEKRRKALQGDYADLTYNLPSPTLVPGYSGPW